MIKHIFTLIWNKKKSNFLLFLEIFFSFMILFAVLSFIVSQLRVYNIPLGFATEDVWMTRLRIDDDRDSAEVAQMKTLLHQELIALPEIEEVSFTGGGVPFSGYTWTTGNDDNGFELQTCIFQADKHYEKASGVKVIEGRWFNDDDKLSKYTPGVITKKLREECYGSKPVLDSLLILDDEDAKDGMVKIVGVIDHYKYHGEFREEMQGTFLYTPLSSKETWVAHLKVKNGIKPEAEEKINNLIASVTKRNDHSIRKIEQERERSSRGSWTTMIALLSISGFLIINVALGLFGVLWFNISKRRSEIGLRRTLGATRSKISQQFIGEIIMVTFIGILFGMFFAAQFPLMKLFDTENINYYYGMLLSSGIILTLVFICAFYPSRQAAKINPAIALHED